MSFDIIEYIDYFRDEMNDFTLNKKVAFSVWCTERILHKTKIQYFLYLPKVIFKKCKIFWMTFGISALIMIVIGFSIDSIQSKNSIKIRSGVKYEFFPI